MQGMSISCAAPRWIDLPTWHAAYGWDTHRKIVSVAVAFNLDRLELTFSSPTAPPRFCASLGIKVDRFGQPMGKVGVLGPLQNASMQTAVHVDRGIP